MKKTAFEHYSRAELQHALEKSIRIYLKLISSVQFKKGLPRGLLVMLLEKWVIQVNWLTIALASRRRGEK